MGIMNKVKNSGIAKTAAKKANDYLNKDKKSNVGKSNKMGSGQNKNTNLKNLKNKI